MSAGHAHDGRQFETLYESLDPDNVLESAILDKGYDADRIRERLSYDGIQPVIPPISTRSKKLPYNKELYRNRNGSILRGKAFQKPQQQTNTPKNDPHLNRQIFQNLLDTFHRGLAPAPELCSYGAPAAATSPSRRL